MYDPDALRHMLRSRLDPERRNALNRVQEMNDQAEPVLLDAAAQLDLRGRHVMAEKVRLLAYHLAASRALAEELDQDLAGLVDGQETT